MSPNPKSAPANTAKGEGSGTRTNSPETAQYANSHPGISGPRDPKLPPNVVPKNARLLISDAPLNIEKSYPVTPEEVVVRLIFTEQDAPA
jgi:hypothetical protein